MQSRKEALPDGLGERLAELFPARSMLTEAEDLAFYHHEERGKYRGEAAIVLLPESTQQLAEAVALCADFGVPVVPQGGNTGLVGGAVSRNREILISMRRMSAIREIDAVNYTMTVEAGAVLAEIQQAAEEVGCLFPLSLAAEGSCTIGGNLSSNAGGVGVLKYGNARELTLGLEVVLADGRIWHGLKSLYKDNSGYSLKNLFVGAEGTLGIITAAVLKLFPAPSQQETALCAVETVQDALALLSMARKQSGDHVTAYELMSAFSLDVVCEHAGKKLPLEQRAPWYVLLEVSTSRPGSELRAEFESLLAGALEGGLISDVVMARSIEQRTRLWQFRELISESQKHLGGSIKHDIAVPVSSLPDFLEEADQAVANYMPGIRVCAFGHLGDGNIHYNLSQPAGMETQAYLEHWQPLNDIVHPIVDRMNGSISAEHGIGLLKVNEVKQYRSAVEQELIETIKNALDPAQQLNPGKLV